jgi:integrase
MARLFRQPYTKPIPPDAQRCTIKGKPAVRFTDDGRTVTAPLTKNGDRIRLLSAKWYGEYVDGDGITRREPLSTDKTAAQQLLDTFVRRAELEKAGVRDPFRDHRKRALTAHRDDWEASLRANGRGDDYVKLKLARLNAILDGCRFVFTADLAADRLELFLAKLRKEHDLSIQTSNDYLQAAKQFARWLMDNDRLDRSPFARLKGGNVKLDRRHDRRDLPPSELTRLLDATGTSTRSFRGLTGGDRFHLYLTACGTGFRAAELAVLTPQSFALDTVPATATLAAGSTKNKKPVIQPLPPEVVEALRGFLADKPPSVPVWPGTWADRSADMLKGDLTAAGIPYEVEGPHGPLFADFHALRHSFITMLERAGISPKTAQKLARHSDIRLTMQRYTHKTLHDLASAVESLPSITPKTGREVLSATGTDARSLVDERPRLPPAYRRREVSCDSAMPDEKGDGPDGSSSGPSKTLRFQAAESNCKPMRPSSAERAGFEPAVGFDPYAALAKRCFRPLSHLSEWFRDSTSPPNG